MRNIVRIILRAYLEVSLGSVEGIIGVDILGSTSSALGESLGVASVFLSQVQESVNSLLVLRMVSKLSTRHWRRNAQSELP